VADDKLCIEPLAHPINNNLLLKPLLVQIPQSAVGAESLSLIFRNMIVEKKKPLKQVLTDDILEEAKEFDTSLKFSPAEQQRLSNSKVCSSAYLKLLNSFLPFQQSLGLGGVTADVGLSQFVAWWLDPKRTLTDRNSVKSILDAQREFDSACLSRSIPTEMGVVSVQAAVGMLVFKDQPVCMALRMSSSSLLTARHCFVEASGVLTPLSLALHDKSGSNRLWFQYEAEPNTRYEVCRSSVPNMDEAELHPERDRIKLVTATTTAPVPNWEWTDAKPGQSLYVRGYFPFSGEPTVLGRLRGSSSGGCAAMVVKGKCVLNGCQSLPLTSGSPVFLRPEPGEPTASIKVVGLHLGSSSYSNTVNKVDCPALRPTDLPSGNFAFQFREN